MVCFAEPMMSNSQELMGLRLADIPPERDGEGAPVRFTDYDWYLLHWVWKALDHLELKKPKRLQLRQTKTLIVKKQFRNDLKALWDQHEKLILQLQEEYHGKASRKK